MATARGGGVGDLDQVVAIDRETTTAGAEIEPTWSEIGRARAAVTPLRATESEREGALRTVQVYQFRVHSGAARAIGIAAKDRLRWLTHPSAPATAYNIREVRMPSTAVPFLDIIAESGVTE